MRVLLAHFSNPDVAYKGVDPAHPAKELPPWHPIEMTRVVRVQELLELCEQRPTATLQELAGLIT